MKSKDILAVEDISAREGCRASLLASQMGNILYLYDALVVSSS
jgi:hypothetical protein